MARRLFCVALAAVMALGVVALSSTPAGAGRCKPDPNPNGRDHCGTLRCPPCFTSVCVQGGKCSFICEPIPGCIP